MSIISPLPTSDGAPLAALTGDEATIEGYKFNDLNGNGQWDQPTEPGLEGWTIYIDANENAQLDAGELSTVTGADGSYTLGPLPLGTYYVGEVQQSGWEQSYPGNGSGPTRLFAVPKDYSNTIVELDPATGAELARFAAPERVSGGPDGLAFDGTSLFFINGYGSDTLWELDPDTGAVRDSDLILAGSGSYNGLAALGGIIYVLDYAADDIIAFDPVTDTVVSVLDIDALNPGVNLSAGVAGITGPNALIARDYDASTVIEIDPATGRVANSFPISANYLGYAVVDGEICLGIGAGGTAIDVFSRSGVFERSIALPYGVSALGGDDMPSRDEVHTVILSGGGQVVANRNFGNWQPATIEGYKWNDLDGDGLWDQPTELGLEGWTIYVDANENGQLDPGELSTTTAPDGSYSLGPLAAGTYAVAEVQQEGWLQTSPSWPDDSPRVVATTPQSDYIDVTFNKPVDPATFTPDDVSILPDAGVSLASIGHIGGLYRDICVVGNYAYAATNVGLEVLDVSNPAEPNRIAFYDGPGYAVSVTIAGDLAYVAVGYSGLHVLDVSNPAAPSLRGSYDTPGYAMIASVVGNFVYVADGSGLQILDVSNPAAPSLAGFCNMPGCVYSVTVVGDVAYVADGDFGLQIFDVADPAAPNLISSHDTPGSARSVAAVANFVYVADGSSGLQILNVADPAAPSLVGSYDTPGSAEGVTVVGNFVYVADGSGLQILDVSNPAAPSLAGFYNMPGYVYSVTVVGDVAYVPGGLSGLQILDVADPEVPSPVGSCSSLAYAQSVTVVGSLAYVADDDSGLQIINVANPAAPSRVGTYDTPGSALSVTVAGDLAYVADGSSLQILNVSNPAAPSLVRTYDTPGAVYSVTVEGDLAYVADYDRGLLILDVANPAAPSRLGSYNTLGFAVGVTVVGDLAYVADCDRGLLILNVADPAAPSLVRTYNTPGAALSVTVAGNLAYVADGSSLQILNVANPAAPSLVGSYDTLDNAYSVTVVGDLAYVADFAAGLQILSIADPAAPILVGSYARGAAYSVTVAGDVAYVALYFYGLWILRNPAAVVSISHVGGATYRLQLGSPLAAGDYTLAITPQIADVFGTLMDQDHDGQPGEFPDDAFHMTWTAGDPTLLVGGAPHVVTVATGQTLTDVNFGNCQPAFVEGFKWKDLNADGIWNQPEEPGLEGWTIYIDANENGQLDTGEPATITAADGSYILGPLVTGTYTVAEVLQTGWSQTCPGVGSGSPHSVELDPGENLADVNFGNLPPAYIEGFKFNDLDGDGLWESPKEPGLEGWTIYIDGNENGQFDAGEISTITDSDGRYTFGPLAPGTYSVAEVLQADWAQTYPSTTAGNTHTVTLVPDEVASEVNFGNQLFPGYIEGFKFNDLDGDGVWDQSDEPGLKGWTIYIDENHNAQWDGPGVEDHYDVTGPDGSYTIGPIAVGSYTVGEVAQEGWVQTYAPLTLDEIDRVSLASDGSQADAECGYPSISADGRFVTFAALDDSSLVPGDTNGFRDLFIYDRQTDHIERISMGLRGIQPDGSSTFSSISADGRFVAFSSAASNLVPGDTNGKIDVFVYDRLTRRIERVSVASDGTEGNDISSSPSISADGQFVTFHSTASNLVPDDTNRRQDIFVYDRLTGETERVSVAFDGTEGNAASRSSIISADGRYVAFTSDASNLVPGHGYGSIFLCDRLTHEIQYVCDRSYTAQ